MIGVKAVVHIGQRGLHQGMLQPVGVVKANERIAGGLDVGKDVLRLAPEGGVHQIMGGGKGHILPVKYDVLQHALDILAVYPVIAVHIHIGHGGGAVAHLEVAHIHPFLGQRPNHPLALRIAAGGADDGGGHAQLA